MQVGEQHLVLAQQVAFFRLRLLDLDDHLGGLEDVGGALGDGGADGAIGVVVEADAQPRAGFDQHLVTMVDDLAHAGRHETDPVFVSFDFLRHADQHGSGSLSRAARTTATHQI